MKKIWNSMVKDIWIVVLDIISVNAAYFLALLVRFYINNHFIQSVSYLLTDFRDFAPYYTVLAILTFAVFRLYGGLWRYAGLNDLNRIVEANLVTFVIQVVGTVLFIRRMPVTYYFIGAVLQFFFLVMTRFGYRLFLTEKKRLVHKQTAFVPSAVIGAGEKVQKIMRHIEDTAYRPVVIVDGRNAGKTLDGIPVVADFCNTTSAVRAVILADPDVSAEEKKKIKDYAAEKRLEFQDFTGYFSNLGGRIPLTSLLEMTGGKVVMQVEGEKKTFESGEEALRSLTDRYDVAEIDEISLRLKKPEETAYAGFDSWAKQHKEQTGEDVSFF